MQEPTHFDMCRILSSGKCSEFFKYINEVLIHNDKIKIVRSHLDISFTLSIGTGVSYYVGVFVSRNEAPNMFFINNEDIIYQKYDQATRSFENTIHPTNDKGTAFNFNLVHPELGVSFDELKVLLEFAQRIKCSFFIGTVQK